MNKHWVTVGNYIFKETDEKFSLISCIIWDIKGNKSYCPAIHTIYKDRYSKEDIVDLVKRVFSNKDDIDFYGGITLLSPFIGKCEDIYDNNGDSVSFNLNEGDILTEKLLSIAKEFNL